jgi:hypothetical protein
LPLGAATEKSRPTGKIFHDDRRNARDIGEDGTHEGNENARPLPGGRRITRPSLHVLPAVTGLPALPGPHLYYRFIKVPEAGRPNPQSPTARFFSDAFISAGLNAKEVPEKAADPARESPVNLSRPKSFSGHN